MREVAQHSSWREIANVPWDAVVVGAGPAGSLAAYLLAKRGWRVLLVDRAPWPREKACGGCLNAAAIAMLRDIGLGDTVIDSHPLTHFIIRRGSRRIVMKLPGGAAIARDQFDDRLVQKAIAQGCTFLPNTALRLMAGDANQPHRRLQLLGNAAATELHARVVLACDGLRGTLLTNEPWAGWLTHPNSNIGISATIQADGESLAHDTIEMYVGAEGYVGLVHQANGKLHIGASLDPAASNRFRGPMHVIRHLLKSCGNAELPDIEHAPFHGTGPLTRRRAAVGGHRVLAIGDACGYVEPFTGEGISWAIRGARAAVNLLPHNSEHWPDSLPATWGQLHAKEIGQRQFWCRRLRNVIRRPALASACMTAARCAPWIPEIMARRISA